MGSAIFLLLGGIGLFLYGINFMSSCLKEAVGEKLRVVLGKMTLMEKVYYTIKTKKNEYILYYQQKTTKYTSDN